MFLKEMRIINWQCIKSTVINFENLMLFIGQSNSGKSSIMSAIMYFLNHRGLRSRDFRNGELYLQVEGRFYNRKREKFSVHGEKVNYKNFWIKVYQRLGHGPKYYCRYTNEWVEISEDEYITIAKMTPVLFIPTVSELEETEFFIRNLLDNLDVRNIEENESFRKINRIFNELQRDYTSHGLYRNLIFEIICEIAAQSEKAKRAILEDTILIYEEPELYLHPQREKELFHCLSSICKLGGQVYVTTHSSNFVSLDHYRSICIIRKEKKCGTKAFQFRGKLFHDDEIKNFNMNYWINPDRSELFFAKKVILVEGQTDKIVLGYLAKRLGIFKYDYSIVECGSKSLIPQFVKLLNIFSIPYIAVYDKDNHLWRSPEELENSNRKNQTIQNCINKNIGSYVEFENDIEEEIYSENRERKNYKNKPFYALKTVSEKDYKLPVRLENKVRKIFE